MNFCANCGHELGVGRFCTNCGRPVPGRHPEAGSSEAARSTEESAEQPTVIRPPAPPPPPASGGTPFAPRYPLYADTTITPHPPAAPPPPGSSYGPAPTYPDQRPGPRPRRGAILVGLVVLLAVLVLGTGFGAYRLIAGDGDASKDAHVPSTGSHHVPSAGARPSTEAPSGSSTPSARGDLADEVARVDVPGTAPASTDLSGNRVTFGSANLFDGDASTAWRVAGDASGSAVTIEFDRPVTIGSVGLINGYAKKYPGYNGYQLNRRISAVRWTFEDGTSVDQDLTDADTLQALPVHAGPTSSLRLEIVSTVPSRRPEARDYTAISEIGLLGSAQ